MARTYTIYPLTKGNYVIFDVDGAQYLISGRLLAILNRDFLEAPAQLDDVDVRRSVPALKDDTRAGQISTYGNESPVQEEGGSYRLSVSYKGDRHETLELPSYVVHALVYAGR